MPAGYIQHPTSRARMRTPIIVGMDPGASKGYAIVDPEDMRVRKSWSAPGVIAMGTSLAEVVDLLPAGALRHRPIWVACEFQYSQRVTTGEISADSIIKLAFRAGYMLRDASALLDAAEMFAPVPQRWKTELYSVGASLAKERFTAKLIRELDRAEMTRLAIIEQKNDDDVDDVLDAIGIAWAVWHVAAFPHRWREWRCDPEHIIPISPKRGQRQRRFKAATAKETEQ